MSGFWIRVIKKLSYGSYYCTLMNCSLVTRHRDFDEPNFGSLSRVTSDLDVNFPLVTRKTALKMAKKSVAPLRGAEIRPMVTPVPRPDENQMWYHRSRVTRTDEQFMSVQ